ncbi:ABC transporter permease [Enterococcus sp. BWB1-3]|uniref:ABC transporter permease n=1 Tax=Enterococcus sp. BWB1-3 TaxID=2787713 RepID=UPI001924CEDE|nr:ABC transporter permease [Enterococcus sp. BWB1-3]MBL1229659.1 ABC transporter permease [Enterococcus sp. BWB1-3]
MIKRLFAIPKELYQNRKLIMTLSINDFKTKYAGSYFGIMWAFIQPVTTILVYWFVFGTVFKSSADRGVPYVLWLVTGLVPWFFVQEGINSGTTTFLEYNYLVKKVVFKISVLPVVKVMSAFFIHIFFLMFVILLYLIYGIMPTLYYFQIIYYSFCIFCFILAISYITSSLVIFFRDLTQIINIVLQVGIWMTPIMWGLSDMGISDTSKLGYLLRLNPIYYVVNGYRTTLINHIGFWEYPSWTLYFWAVTLLLFLIGMSLFKKLRIHFADVL